MRLNWNRITPTRVIRACEESTIRISVFRLNLSAHTPAMGKLMVIIRTVIKEATAQEMVELDKNMWQKMKEKFKKVD